ncbi:MAG: diheme cytochrome c-553 [Ignavibacteriaceae bacterium]|nr:diheme cytochrome c-553 [Ignavibacteriaceae bacterium]
MKVNGLVFVYLSLFFVSAIALLVGCQSQPEKTEITDQQIIERGEFLVTAGGCDDCHTPKNFGPKGPELDMTRRFSGHPEGTPIPPVDTTLLHQWAYLSHDLTMAVGPWGVTFSANLTPDNETGIGTWQPEMFINAMKTGKHLGVADGRPILPPMPWQSVARLSEEDLKAMFMYLKTLPAVKNKVPNPMPPGSIASVR